MSTILHKLRGAWRIIVVADDKNNVFQRVVKVFKKNRPVKDFKK